MSETDVRDALREHTRRIHAYYTAVRRAQTGIAACAAVLAWWAAWCGALVCAAACDYLLMPGVAGRRGFALMVYCCATGAAAVVFARSWRRTVARRALVARMEAHLPGIRHGLATFLDCTAATPGAGCHLLEELAGRVWRRCAAAPPRVLRTRQPLRAPAYVLAAATLALAWWLWHVPAGRVAVRRVLAPGAAAPYTQVHDTTTQDAVENGAPMHISAALSGRAVPHAYVTLVFTNDVVQALQIAPSNGALAVDVQGITQPFSYHIRAGDGATPPRAIPVVFTPVLTASYAEVSWPAYTRRGVTREDTGRLRVLRGSSTDVCWWFARDIGRAELLSDDGRTHDVQIDGARCSAHCTPDTTTVYTLRVHDAQTPRGMRELPLVVHVYEDAPPAVRILHPVHDLTLPDDYAFFIEAQINDDVGMCDAALVYQINHQPVRRIPLYRADEAVRALVVTHRFSMAEITVREHDILSYYIAARDIRDGAAAEGRSRLMFVEITPASYAEDGGGGGMRMFDPFPQLIRIQKRLVADVFELQPRTNMAAQTSATRHALAQRASAVADAASRLHAVFITKATNYGLALALAQEHAVARAFTHVARASGRNATNLLENRLPLAYAQAQELLAFLLSSKMPQSGSSGSGDDDELSEEEKIMQALRLAEREESRKIEDERQRRLARLGDLEEDVAELDSLQRHAARQMQRDAAQPDSSAARASAAQTMQKAARKANAMATAGGNESDTLQRLQHALEQAAAWYAEGRDDEARAVLDEALEMTQAMARDVVQQRHEELASAFHALGQQLALLAGYQHALQRETAQHPPGASAAALAAQQRAAQEWWQELRAQTRQLTQFTAGMPPEFDERAVEFAQELHDAPVTRNLADAAEALNRDDAPRAVAPQTRAHTELAALAERAHAHAAAFMPDELRAMEQMARELAQAAELQQQLAARFAEGQPPPDEFERGHLVKQQEAMMRRVTAAQAMLGSGMAPDVQGALGRAAAAVHAALSVVESSRAAADISAQAQAAGQELRRAHEVVQAALRHSAVVRLQRLRRDAQAAAAALPPVLPSTMGAELRAIHAALSNSDAAVMLQLVQARWDDGAHRDAGSTLRDLADGCLRAIAVLELPKLVRVEALLQAAMRDRQDGAGADAAYAAAYAAVASVIDDTHTRALAVLLAQPGADAALAPALRSHIRALEPLADAWVRALLSRQRELVFSEETPPPQYSDIVNEYLRILSYQ